MISATNHPQSIGFKPFFMLQFVLHVLHIFDLSATSFCNNLQQFKFVQQPATIFYKQKLIISKLKLMLQIFKLVLATLLQILFTLSATFINLILL